MKNTLRIILAALMIAALPAVSCTSTSTPEKPAVTTLNPDTPEALEARIAWWKEARFGMFIHWGLYAVPAGNWKGEFIAGIGEWIMFRAKIPVEEYEALAQEFNPVKFDAEEWVSYAKAAGMKYLTITSKHHDGFAMYKSQASAYNIVDATPFTRDPMKELTEACRKADIKLCFYYSQTQDWHEPQGDGNTWDFPEKTAEGFEHYLQDKVEPQVREILTQYGPIGMIWFDTPKSMTREQSLRLKHLVHSIQPECLVSGRVGNDIGDYVSMGDNQIPPGGVPGYWETPATMNDTWAFKTDDHDWKSTTDLLRLLVDIASKGGNYLLNVGPTKEGIIPPESIERLHAIGRWMDVNSQAIYGTDAGPYAYEFDWGRITRKTGKLYLHFFEWPKEDLHIYGLKNRVVSASLLAEPTAQVQVKQTHDATLDHHVLTLSLPRQQPDPHVSVVALEIEGDAAVDALPLQQPDGTIKIPTLMGTLHTSAGDKAATIGPTGATANWNDTDNSLEWNFKVLQPGKFTVKVITAFRRSWQGGHTVTAMVNGKKLTAVLKEDERILGTRTKYKPEIASILGTIDIPEAGTHTLTLKADELAPKVSEGLTVSYVQLVPTQ
jgi:alpha-L-fucosidase